MPEWGSLRSPSPPPPLTHPHPHLQDAWDGKVDVLFTFTDNVRPAVRKKLTERIERFEGETRYEPGGEHLCKANVLVVGKGDWNSPKAVRAERKELPLITVEQLEERLDELEVGFLAGVG